MALMRQLRQLSGLILYPKRLWGRGSIDLLFLGAEEHLILCPQKFGHSTGGQHCILCPQKLLYFMKEEEEEEEEEEEV